MNHKTVDPRDPESTRVVHLETAMGSAIESLADTAAIDVPRTRFSPVKSTADLLALRSDAYVLSRDLHIELAPSRALTPPNISLSAEFKHLDAFEQAFPLGVPSLLECRSLNVSGPVTFDANVTIRGDVSISSTTPARLAGGTYQDQTIEL